MQNVSACQFALWLGRDQILSLKSQSYCDIFHTFASAKSKDEMRKHTFKEWMIAVRPWSFPASTMPVIVTMSYLFWKDGASGINWLFGLWALVNIVVFHAAGNTWSDWFDYRKKVDAEDTFGSKTLTSGMFAPGEIMRLSVALTVVACAGGIGLLVLTGLPLLWIGLGGVACTLLYPALKYHALGDVVILAAYAFLPTLGTSYVVTGAIDWNVLWIALPVGLVTDGILHANNTRDIMTDRRCGITTMAMGLGMKASAWVYGFEMVFPYVWLGICPIAGIMPLWTIIVFLTLPAAIACARTMRKAVDGGGVLIAALDVRTVNVQQMFSLLRTLAFAVDGLI